MLSAHTRRWWGLGALALAMLALGFDMTILNVALTTLSQDLHAGTGALQWIVDSYVLVFAALLLPAGALGDRFGRKRLLLAGLAIFGAASLAGAYAGGTGGVIAARAFMGVGAAIIMPLSMSMLPAIFPPAERTRAIALWTASMALGLPLGPLTGGWLLEHFWWGSIFLINVPLAAVGGLAVALLLPETRDPAAPPVDGIGALLSMAGLVALVYGVIEGPARGWGDPLVLGAVAAALVLLTGFTLWERRLAQPMVDLALFRDRVFVWSLVAGIFATLVMAGALFVLPQYLQAVQGHGAFGTGLRLIPMLLGLMAGGLATDRLTGPVGRKPIIVTGLFVLAAGLGLGALTGTGDGYGFAAGWLSVTGAGIGLTLIPAMDALLASMPDDQAGRGSGLVQTLRQTGSALGIAGLGSLVSSVYRDRIATGGLPAEAAHAARDSVGEAALVAAQLCFRGDTPMSRQVAGSGCLDPRYGALLKSAQEAYVAGMDVLLATCAAGALAVAALTLLFLPGRGADAEPGPDDRESDHEHVVT
ncbi:DHA2 family efflux MFS transporter permease subunit [Actinomadura macrotermitis]|uniref:Antiseptic resistance protein n=1 Tax=Actinomadura macrotermitis TaxID=2585200 RepID=A0A7K0BRU6_9ACTN|nr:DHA2 family efflux MFS transporter permease subunit [Actinomadura macrotermitis]MQY03923.1 Antiseptic resistance protein [Actinomadura macrotermitis]